MNTLLPIPMSAELAPCPFCGKEAAPGTITYAKNSDIAKLNGQHVFHFIKCVWCGSNNQNLIGWKDAPSATAHWNTRTGGNP